VTLTEIVLARGPDSPAAYWWAVVWTYLQPAISCGLLPGLAYASVKLWLDARRRGEGEG
jgi:hypothetical protein